MTRYLNLAGRALSSWPATHTCSESSRQWSRTPWSRSGDRPGLRRRPACGATVNVRTLTWLMLPRSITEASTRRPGAATSMRRAHAAAVGSADPRDSYRRAHATRISRPTRLGSADPRDSDRPTDATRIGRPTRLGSAEPNEADGNFESRGARCIPASMAGVLAAWRLGKGARCMAGC